MCSRVSHNLAIPSLRHALASSGDVDRGVGVVVTLSRRSLGSYDRLEDVVLNQIPTVLPRYSRIVQPGTAALVRVGMNFHLEELGL